MTANARNYDSSRRQQQGRDRILEAALGLARARAGWNWADITFKAVADAAEVSERTVYRHFPTQRDLHDAMLLRINEHAAISYDDLALEDVVEVSRRLFTSLSTFTPELSTRALPSAAAIAMNRERMQALLRATEGDVRLAALLDVLWSNETYERLAVGWQLSTEDAVEAVTWALEALVSRRRPGDPDDR
ncbi:AcrR family transcriptional regulator [Nocardioides daedukensis]|uniref:AcrR family transcriptional regulator n=1 Tax=Nocardioides daedukensis TaxID=634462 RepID=A0A7Y9UTX7_9ACTN|nr:TetR/AcrR family transcriptional regulator [Nocardioides daedukensis]NYG59444.1 AcrR family transcriptional regulator [Nocardioides daedukensis]